MSLGRMPPLYIEVRGAAIQSNLPAGRTGHTSRPLPARQALTLTLA
jgi:hypothetical protein